MRVIGMISGTSFDGIDVAVADLELEGGTVALRPLAETSHPYSPELRAAIADALPPRPASAAQVCALDTRIGQAFAAAACSALDTVDGAADLVASHGQTLYHWVDDRRALGTLQLGQPAWIAAETGLPVVADLRARDIAHGGHGAPLASTLDVLLLGRDAPRPRAALNLGGIANLTVVGGGIDPIAFDTGPGNALLDVAVAELTSGRASFDSGGELAAAGRVDGGLLERLLGDPYYALEPPKSTGKETFHLPYLRKHLGDRPVDADVLATLVALTAETVARWCRHYGAADVVASGGGVANPTLMAALGERLPGVRVRTIDELGLPAAAKEAYVFALLGFLTVHDLPGAVPSCTGAREPAILGAVVPGRHGLPRPERTAATAPSRLRIEGAQ
ncbi:MAG: anhydro-N-acetylmuramic acid kinase [Actinomycetota bacterium]